MGAALGDSMAYAIDERVGWLTMANQSSFPGVFVFLSLGPDKAYVNPFAGAETLKGKTWELSSPNFPLMEEACL